MPGIVGFIQKSNQTGTERLLGNACRMLRHREHYTIAKKNWGYASLAHITAQGDAEVYEVECNDRQFLVAIDGSVHRIGGRKVDSTAAGCSAVARRMVAGFINKREVFVRTLEGNYAVVIYDVDEQTVYLFNDIFGARRLYYADTPHFFAFAPEMKAICFQSGFNKELNSKALADFFNYGYVLGTDTFFTAIQSLPSATLLEFNARSGRCTTTRYWRARYEPGDGTLDSVSEQTLELLKDSLSDKVECGHRVISPISGGLDSRLILAVLCGMRRNLSVKAMTYGQKFSYEYKNARVVCRKLGITDHTLVCITPEKLSPVYEEAVWLSEGMIPMHNAHLLLFPAELGLQYDSLLNGIYGGPTNFAALYYSQRHLGWQGGLDEKVHDIRRIIAVDPTVYANVLSEEMQREVELQAAESIRIEFEKHRLAADSFPGQRDSFFIENRMRRFINQSSLYRFFWREQLPLASYPLYEHYLTIPYEHLVGRCLLKHILKRFYPALASIRDANTGLNLFRKPGVLHRVRKDLQRKMQWYAARLTKAKLAFYDAKTYAHYEQWLQRHTPTLCFYESQIRSRSTAECGIIRPRGAERLLHDVSNGRVGFEQLIRIVTYAVWHKRFLDRQS